MGDFGEGLKTTLLVYGLAVGTAGFLIGALVMWVIG